MRSFVSICCALLLAAPAAVAQSVTVPNANAGARGTGGLNTLTRNAGNPRTYQLGISASELAGIPAGSIINGISFRSSVTTSNAALWPPSDATWTPYEITLGDAIPLASWTTTFATNMSNTIMVRAGPMTIPMNTYTNNTALPAPTPNAWGDFFFDFQTPFPYGGGDLALLFTHPGSNIATALFLDTVASIAAGPYRALSASSFQAATGGTSTVCISRVHYGYGAGCPGSGAMVPNLVLSNNVSGGGSCTFAVTNGPAGAPGIFVIGLGQGSIPLPNGCTLLVSPIVGILPFALAANGTFFLPLTFPAGASAQVAVQAALMDVGAPGGYSATNGVTLTISP